MIVDTSAFLAIIFREDGYPMLIEKMLEADVVIASAATLAETSIVLQARLAKRADGLLERVLDEFSVQEVEFGALHWREAAAAYRAYGKGRHPAALNFGDCMTYAAAKLTGEALLFVGKDFSRTDIPAA